MKGERAADGRTYWGRRPDELAALCVADAAERGYTLVLRDDTPVVPDEACRDLSERAIWSDVGGLFRRLGDIGSAWVNLRFSVDPDGRATVRYEAKPDGEPLPDGGIPATNGGFDAPRSPSLPTQPPHR